MSDQEQDVTASTDLWADSGGTRFSRHDMVKISLAA